MQQRIKKHLRRRPSSSSAAKKARTRPAVMKRSAPLLAIDGDSFAHRSYHALPKTILTKDRRPAGAILGFANFLLRIYHAERPRAVIVCWDTLSAPTYRHEALAAYQSGREFDAALIEQLSIIPRFVDACGFANAQAPGYEADDLLAAAVSFEERRRGCVIVASGDRDTFQLASDRTTVVYPVRAGEVARIGPDEVRQRYGVDPEQVPDFIALRGDPSDKIPGVPGLGAAGAAAFLRRHGTLEAGLKAGRYPAYADRLRLYRRIATMDRKAPLPRVRSQKPRWSEAAQFAKQLGLNQLAERLMTLAAAPS